jgi:hypothetical protein
MPVISRPITQEGAVISVLVGVNDTRRRLLLARGSPIPPPTPVLAVIDTGSFATGFRPEILRALGIEPFRRIPILTPSTRPDAPHICDLYDVSLTLIAGTTQRRLRSLVAIASQDFGEHGIQALIGRDVLNHCVFSYFGPHGTFELSF